MNSSQGPIPCTVRLCRNRERDASRCNTVLSCSVLRQFQKHVLPDVDPLCVLLYLIFLLRKNGREKQLNLEHLHPCFKKLCQMFCGVKILYGVFHCSCSICFISDSIKLNLNPSFSRRRRRNTTENKVCFEQSEALSNARNLNMIHLSF